MFVNVGPTGSVQINLNHVTKILHEKDCAVLYDKSNELGRMYDVDRLSIISNSQCDIVPANPGQLAISIHYEPDDEEVRPKENDLRIYEHMIVAWRVFSDGSSEPVFHNPQLMDEKTFMVLQSDGRLINNESEFADFDDYFNFVLDVVQHRFDNAH